MAVILNFIMPALGISVFVLLILLKTSQGTGTTAESVTLVASIIVMTVFFSFLSLWSQVEDIDPFNYARITALDYIAVVSDDPGSDGKVHVRERITFDIRQSESSDGIWELWRVLPETDFVEGVKNEYTVLSVKQIIDDGTEVIYQETSWRYMKWEDYYGERRLGFTGPGRWHHSPGPYNGRNELGGRFESLFIYVENLREGQVTFEIEYEMTNAALRYGDSSELYLVFAYDYNIIYLESFKAEILFPDEIMPRAGNFDVYTYGTNAHELPFTQSSNRYPGYYTFSIDLDESQLRFRPYNRYLEFALVAHGEDKHIFTQNAMENYFHNTNMMAETNAAQAEYEALPGRWMVIKLCVFALCLLLSLLILRYALTIDRRMNKKYKFFKPVRDIQFFRDIPADIDSNFAAVLVFCKHYTVAGAIDIDGYAAVMLSLVRKGYIELERIDSYKDWKHENMKLIVKHIPEGTTIEPLSEVEVLYYNLILRHTQRSPEIALTHFVNMIKDDCGYTASFVENVDNAVIQKGLQENYFQTKDFNKPFDSINNTIFLFYFLGVISLIPPNVFIYNTRLDFAFGAFFILGLSFFIAGGYMRKHAYKYHLLTQFGEDEYAKWRGLYNFLNSNTLMHERTVIDLPLWEKYLIYATEFGISKKVIKALEVRAPSLNINNSALLRNPYYRTGGLHVSSRAFRSAARSAVSLTVSGSSSSAARGGVGGGG